MSDAMPQMLRWYWFLPDGRYVPIEDAALQEVRPTRPRTPAVPQSKYVPPAGWRRLAVGETLTDDDWVIDPSSGAGRPTSQAGQLVGQNQIYICRIGPERQPQSERVQVCEGRWLTRSGAVQDVTPTPTEDPALMAELFPWCDRHTPDGQLRTWRDDGRYDTEEGEWDLVKYLGPLQSESDKTPEPQPEFTIPEGWRRLQVGEILQPGDQIVQTDDGRRYPTHRVGDAVGEKQQYIRRIESEPVPQTETQSQPIQVREGRWLTRGGDIRSVTPMSQDHEKDLAHCYCWWDGCNTWRNDGRYMAAKETTLDLVKYLGPLQAEPQPQLEPPSVNPSGPTTLQQIIQRCEAKEPVFDNQDMSVVLQEVYRLRRIIISQFE